MKYFFQELKRAFLSIRTLGIFILSLVLVYLGTRIDLMLYVDDGVHRFINGYILSPGNLLNHIMPILVVVPYATSFIEDKEGGFLKNIYTRKKKESYLKTKLLVNGLVGGVVSALPGLICLTVYLILYTPCAGVMSQGMGGALNNIYFESPILYCLFDILLGFIYGVTFSTFAMAVSAFTENKYIVTLSSFIYVVITASVFYVAKINYVINFDGTMLLHLYGDKSFYYKLVYALLLIIIGAGVFYFKNLKCGEKCE